MGLINTVFIWTKQVPFIQIVIFPSLPKETLMISPHGAAPPPHTSVPSRSLVADRTMIPKETHLLFKDFHFCMSLCCLGYIWKYSTASGFFSLCKTRAHNTFALHSVHTYIFGWNTNVQWLLWDNTLQWKILEVWAGINISVKFGRLKIPA